MKIEITNIRAMKKLTLTEEVANPSMMTSTLEETIGNQEMAEFVINQAECATSLEGQGMTLAVYEINQEDQETTLGGYETNLED